MVPDHRDMKTENVSFSCDNASLGFVLGLWTFRGRLNIQVWCNVSFHGDDQIPEVMNYD